MDEGLRLDGVRIWNAERCLVEIDTLIAAGGVLTVMGPSGVGKSTLLSAISGTLAPAFRLEGRVVLNGIDITTRPAHQRKIGLLFQDHLLFPHLSVGQNLAFGLAPQVRNRQQAIEAALEDIRLAGMAKRDPATLSGGQRARVALMRTLLSAPKALLLDEPFSRLDAALRVEMRRLVFDRARNAGLPVLMVTHDQADADAAEGDVLHLG